MKTDPITCEWLKVQTAALEDDPANDEKIKLSVLEAQRLSVKLPVVKKVAKSITLKDAEGKERSLNKDQIVICDVVSSVLSCICVRLPIKHLLIKHIFAVPRLPSQRRLQHR